jgi:aminodeoxyfutalosine deaminase
MDAESRKSENLSFIRSLPKADLHLHLEGSVDAPTLSELSRRHHHPAPFPNSRYQPLPDAGRALSENDVLELYRYPDFLGFLMAFKAVTERLRTPEDYELITYRLLQRLRSENVLHAEVYVSVGVVHWRGQDFAPIFDGLESGRLRGERDFGVSLLWIFDAVRHFGVEAAQRVAETAVLCRARSESVAGLGIGGDERRAAAELFREVYAYARQRGLHLVAHAGETVGPDSVWGAINIGAERLGHALSAVHDPELLATLAEKQIPLEICLSSNVKTSCCQKISDHPLRRYFDQGLMVTLNTDDPAMFGTTLAGEYELAERHFDFTSEHLRELARNSFEASFLPAQKKLEFLHLIDAMDLNSPAGFRRKAAPTPR